MRWLLSLIVSHYTVCILFIEPLSIQNTMVYRWLLRWQISIQMLRTDPDTVSKAFKTSLACFIYVYIERDIKRDSIHYTLYIMMRYHNNIATSSWNFHFHNALGRQRLEFWGNKIHSQYEDQAHVILKKILKLNCINIILSF